MDKNMLIGFLRMLLPVPPAIWQKHGSSRRGGGLEFMTEAHHRVRDFTVLELTRSGKPLSVEQIAEAIQLPQSKVQEILDELEHHKTFIYRTNRRDVTWAYPVTVEPTPHRLHLSSGEQVYAA